jgi:HPt (histidine-containing phosphotransfer) domain-containing protein
LESQFKYLNIQKIQNFAENDKSFIKDMLNSFINNTPEYINSIKSAFENKEWEELAKAIHKIKPTFQYLSIEPIKLPLEQAEKFAKDDPQNQKLPSVLEEVYLMTLKSIEEAKVFFNQH